MSFSFDGKVAIVTGAGGGLGYAYAEYLAQHGARVIINDLGGGTFGFDAGPNASVAEQAAQRIRQAGGEALANGANVADFAAVKGMIEQAMDTWGRVDAVINNAGIASTQVFPNVEADELHRHLDVHVIGTVNLMRAAWPHMVAQKFGRIVNTASNSFLGFSPQISYPSMKSALFGLSNSIALLGKQHNIAVNVIFPAAFTRLSAMLPDCEFRTRLENEFQPEKLAPVVAYLCHESCELTGEYFSVGGGKYARLVFAETDSAAIDMTMDSVANSLQDMTAADVPLRIMNSTFDDLKNLGFSEEECSIFHNMTATMEADADAAPHEAVAKSAVDNVWDIVVKSPVGDQKSVLTLKSDGNSLRGNMKNEQYGIQEAFQGEIKGETLVWKTKISKPVPMTLTYTGSLDASDNMQGTLKLGMFGESKFTASPCTDQAERTEAAERLAQQAETTTEQKPGFIKKLFTR